MFHDIPSEIRRGPRCAGAAPGTDAAPVVRSSRTPPGHDHGWNRERNEARNEQISGIQWNHW